jgi:hypothetical protein
MTWVPKELNALTGLPSGTTLIELFNSLSRELKRLEDEIEKLKKEKKK